MSDFSKLEKQIEFIVEIDKLKQVMRQTSLIDKSRRENDAEHSWHLAIMAIILGEYADNATDLLHVVKMVLVHDLVEIDAGDTFAFDPIGYEDKDEREAAAADRLFSMLPEEQGKEIRELWEEFERQETLEAKFAAALDRLQPLLHNYYTDGGTWAKFHVTSDRVFKRAEPISEASPHLGQYAKALIEKAIERGLIPDQE